MTLTKKRPQLLVSNGVLGNRGGAVVSEPLKAPFPYPGGKSKVADLVWSRLGDVDNYVEPFAGSLAVLLRRPADHFADGYRVETVNDLNHYLVNFWRAVKADPEGVAKFADSPVIEADLHARHKWLVRSAEAVEWRAKMVADPDHYDAKIAGWWVWGQCCWIGGQWCQDGVDHKRQMPTIDQHGVNNKAGGPVDWVQPPELSSGQGRGDAAALSGATDHKRKMPNLGQECATGGIGVHGVGGPTDWQQPPKVSTADSVCGRPQLTDAFDIGRGVNANGNAREFADKEKRPALKDPANGNGSLGFITAAGGWQNGTCAARRDWLTGWMTRLADRLRLVRTCYGHWSRICDSDSTLTRLGTTGVFLDPPYPANRGDTGKKSRDAALYATDRGADLDALRNEVLAWCRKWGDSPLIRIAVCGYEGDGYEALGWTEHAWEANGGYANQRRAGKGKADNARRERIWFSPACLTGERKPVAADLFAEAP